MGFCAIPVRDSRPRWACPSRSEGLTTTGQPSITYCRFSLFSAARPVGRAAEKRENRRKRAREESSLVANPALRWGKPSGGEKKHNCCYTPKGNCEPQNSRPCNLLTLFGFRHFFLTRVYKTNCSPHTRSPAGRQKQGSATNKSPGPRGCRARCGQSDRCSVPLAA